MPLRISAGPFLLSWRQQFPRRRLRRYVRLRLFEGKAHAERWISQAVATFAMLVRTDTCLLPPQLPAGYHFQSTGVVDVANSNDGTSNTPGNAEYCPAPAAGPPTRRSRRDRDSVYRQAARPKPGERVVWGHKLLVPTRGRVDGTSGIITTSTEEIGMEMRKDLDAGTAPTVENTAPLPSEEGAPAEVAVHFLSRPDGHRSLWPATKRE